MQSGGSVQVNSLLWSTVDGFLGRKLFKTMMPFVESRRKNESVRMETCILFATYTDLCL